MIRIENNAGPLENPSFPLNSPEAVTIFSGGGRTKAGIAVNPGTAIQHAPFWRALNILSMWVGRMPIDLVDEQTGEHKREHPSYYLLNVQPNQAMKAFDFKRTLQFHAAFLGNGYAGILNRGKDPAELLILNPYDTFPLKVDGRLVYITKINDQRIALEASEVFHVHGLSFDGMIGYSLIDIMAGALSLPMAAQEYGARFFGEGTLISGYLYTPSHLSPEQKQNAEEDFKTMNQGMQNAHAVGVLYDGCKFIPTAFSPEQAQFLETRKFEISTISNITGVPAHKLGDSSRATYNTLEQENQSFLDEGLDPWLVEWEQEARIKLLQKPERVKYAYRFNRREITRNDSAGRSAFYASGRQWGWLSTNDCRRMENMPGIGPQGDIYLVPENMADAKRLLDPPADEGEAEPKEIPAAVTNSNREAIANMAQRLVNIHAKQITERAKSPDDFRATCSTFLAEQRDKMVDAILPAAKVWFAISNKSSAGDSVCAAVDEYINGLKDDLQFFEPGNLLEAAPWTQRGLALVNTLMQR
jgi:HK97 family phage portal protein